MLSYCCIRPLWPGTVQSATSPSVQSHLDATALEGQEERAASLEHDISDCYLHLQSKDRRRVLVRFRLALTGLFFATATVS